MTDGAAGAWPEGDPRVAEILGILAARRPAWSGSASRRRRRIASLDIASLDMVQAMFALESHFGVEIPVAVEQEGGEFPTVGDLVQPRAGRRSTRGAGLTARRRVVVTGMGAVCATGHDVGAFLAALRAGRVGIGPIANIPTERLAGKIAAEIRGLDMAAHFTAKRRTLLDRSSQLALIAAREAMAQAGLARGDAEDGAVILGAAIGQEAFDQSYMDLYGQGLPRVHPFTVPRIMPNAAASHVSIEFGIRGPCYAVASPARPPTTRSARRRT